MEKKTKDERMKYNSERDETNTDDKKKKERIEETDEGEREKGRPIFNALA